MLKCTQWLSRKQWPPPENLIRSLTYSSSSFRSDDNQQVKDLQAKNPSAGSSLAVKGCSGNTDDSTLRGHGQPESRADDGDGVAACRCRLERKRKTSVMPRGSEGSEGCGRQGQECVPLAAANEDLLELQDRDRKNEAKAAEAHVEFETARFDLRQSSSRVASGTRRRVVRQGARGEQAGACWRL